MTLEDAEKWLREADLQARAAALARDEGDMAGMSAHLELSRTYSALAQAITALQAHKLGAALHELGMRG